MSNDILTLDPVRPIAVIQRVFNAPRRLVFELLTQPEHVRRWYGPRYLSMTCLLYTSPSPRD